MIAKGRLTAVLLIGCVSMGVASGSSAKSPPAPEPTAAQYALNGYWGTWKAFLAGANAAPNHKPTMTGAKDLAIAATKLQPWARAKYDHAVDADRSGHFVPSAVNKCYPADIPGLPLVDAYSFAILIEPRQIAFMSEGGRTMRFVRINGQHPAHLEPSWTGDSIGHWEGDTLVIDTIGFNDRAELPHNLPMTSKMHIVERLHVADGTLEDQATYDDPGAFTAPFTVDTHFGRSEAFQEYICAENNREGGVPTASGKPTAPVVSGLQPQ